MAKIAFVVALIVMLTGTALANDPKDYIELVVKVGV